MIFNRLRTAKDTINWLIVFLLLESQISWSKEYFLFSKIYGLVCGDWFVAVADIGSDMALSNGIIDEINRLWLVLVLILVLTVQRWDRPQFIFSYKFCLINFPFMSTILLFTNMVMFILILDNETIFWW